MRERMDISVVIPAYNREKTIRTAIQSVLNQTVLPQKIIIIDDCSTDRTVEIVREFCAENQNLCLLEQKKNFGAQAARNRGIQEAKTEWIAFLDSDDEWLPNKLELQKRAIEKNPEYDIYYGDYYIQKRGRKHYKNCGMTGRNGNCLKAVLFNSQVLFQGMIVRKEVLQEIGLLDEKVLAYQEWDLNISLAQKYKYYYINKPLFIYKLHEGETISKDIYRGIQGFRYIVKKNASLFLDSAGMESIIFYYDGLYVRYKICKDRKQYYYMFVINLLRILSLNSVIKNKTVDLIRCYLRKGKLGLMVVKK